MHEPDPEARVGYANPPQDGQFKPGESGNAGGLPKHARNKNTILREIASEEQLVTIRGQKQKIMTIELLFMRLRELAMQGDEKALDAFNEWTAKFEQEAEATWSCGLLLPEQRYEWDSPLQIEEVDDTISLTSFPARAPMDLN